MKKDKKRQRKTKKDKERQRKTKKDKERQRKTKKDKEERRRKKSMGDTDYCVAPPPGNSDGFAGPKSAEAALPPNCGER